MAADEIISNAHKLNKYALACAAVASVISIIFGYGNLSNTPFSFFFNLTYNQYQYKYIIYNVFRFIISIFMFLVGKLEIL